MKQFAKEVGPLSLECHVFKGYYVRGETQTLPRVNFVHNNNNNNNNNNNYRKIIEGVIKRNYVAVKENCSSIFLIVGDQQLLVQARRLG